MHRKAAATLIALPLLLGACDSSGTPTVTESEQAAGEPWVVVEPGKPVPSVAEKFAGTLKPALPPVSFLPTTEACAIPWPEQEQVLIPMVVTPGTGSLTVQWPNRYGTTYRLTAVPQDLVSGAQPEPAWQTVSTGTECEVTATISGLISGEAYIVWLDAPNTPRRLDGSRSLYSGKSRVIVVP